MGTLGKHSWNSSG